MDNIINLSPMKDNKSIPELLRKLADDIENGTIASVKGCTIALQIEVDTEMYAFDIFGWGDWVQTRADLYWSLMKASNFVL